jgi:hypothetical protein
MSNMAAQISQTRQRHFFVLGAIIALLVTVGGFARTYYLKAAFGTPQLSSLVHLHGFVMTGWFTLFAVQTWLVASGKTQVHRKLGILGCFWALAVIVVGSITGVVAAKFGRPNLAPPLIFLVVPLADMLQFGILVGCGIYFRKTRDIHRRLMLLATLGMLTAAFARIQLAFIQHHTPLVPFILTDLIVLAFVGVDTFKHRRLHPAFGWGATLILASFPLRMALAGTPMWTQFAGWLVSLV